MASVLALGSLKRNKRKNKVTRRTGENINYELKTEAKLITQAHYGGYCEMCRALDEEMVPYHLFTGEIYDEIKTQFKLQQKQLKHGRPST